MLTGVLDANVVVGLAKGGVLDLLPKVYAPLYVPPAVVQEVVIQGKGRPGATELAHAIGVWITEEEPDTITMLQFSAVLPPADREVLAIARAKAVDQILSGDWQLRQEARRHGFACLMASDVVVLLKQEGYLAAVRPVLDRMRQGGFGIDEPAYQQALEAAGE